MATRLPYWRQLELLLILRSCFATTLTSFEPLQPILYITHVDLLVHVLSLFDSVLDRVVYLTKNFQILVFFTIFRIHMRGESELDLFFGLQLLV